MSISFNTFPQGTNHLELNTAISNYGISFLDIKNLGNGDDDDNYYYVYFTTDETIYTNAFINSVPDSESIGLTQSPPVITISGKQKGFLLYNNNISHDQAAFLIRIRNGNYDKEPLNYLKSAECYPGAQNNMPLGYEPEPEPDSEPEPEPDSEPEPEPESEFNWDDWILFEYI